MPGIGKSKHEKVLNVKVLELEKEGYRVIKLNGKSPDAIAVMDNKIFAVEAEGINRRTREGKQGRRANGFNRYHVNAKRKQLSMFDGVIFAIFER